MEDLLKKLRALAEPTRLRITTLLYRGELTVSELMQILGQSQPRVSRHLKMLVDAGLAERLPEGAWVFYRLAKNAVGEKLAALIDEMAHAEDADLARDLQRLAKVKQIRADAARRYFENAADNWQKIRALYFPEAEVEEALRAAAGPGPFKLHLDVGTGTGRILELFADVARDGIGIDLSHEMLNVARSKIADAGLTDRFVRQADAGALPIDTGTADLVTMHQVLHYLDDPQRALHECGRVMAPGGRLIVVDFAPHGHEVLRAEHHHRRLGFEPDEIAGWLEESGLGPANVTTLEPDDPAAALTVLIWTAEKRVAASTAAGLTAQSTEPVQ
ncbi:ArsR family transcriptional regulator [Marinicauda pacifica]|jgi:ubiquinone/menaquinone biosynthesis C-methylase UbiE/DNA-binding transcriptional ArsR family regulator|uniref:Metalloregulator ArsR/SmtB family transcription factor n=1 Tax=Marinicauda pacifica TaxID=1133559 RepID=A0A4S2H7V4_9PROT|nr:metalloregulator ArsR/SmtB family transcription factor [Marinicauda pacifica]TGY91894.1 metalloregulator ArsR/SmtB family transcription factor [Marinicauda pacifica]GGE49898.1 ArsR family transcriptional regulator [Marinicauda pacifica]